MAFEFSDYLGDKDPWEGLTDAEIAEINGCELPSAETEDEDDCVF